MNYEEANEGYMTKHNGTRIECDAKCVRLIISEHRHNMH